MPNLAVCRMLHSESGNFPHNVATQVVAVFTLFLILRRLIMQTLTLQNDFGRELTMDELEMIAGGGCN
ncbi:hypothetical protein ACFPVS_00300 [Neisseria weixii]|uniref:hypothetical protein n=1 Tax=Neisseria weixii TaxID=1853276 RepID=UPI000F50FA2C|nr:hypothetical protein [Neisseria weixii]